MRKLIILGFALAFPAVMFTGSAGAHVAHFYPDAPYNDNGRYGGKFSPTGETQTTSSLCDLTWASPGTTRARTTVSTTP